MKKIKIGDLVRWSSHHDPEGFVALVVPQPPDKCRPLPRPADVVWLRPVSHRGTWTGHYWVYSNDIHTEILNEGR